MKKIDYKLGIIIGLIGLSLFQYFNPTIKEVELIKEVEVEVVKTIIDSVYVDNIIEKKIYYPKYITKVDTVEVVKEIIVEKPVTKIKKIYRERKVEKIVEVPVNVKKMFIGFGYQYDVGNYFSGASIRLLHKTPKDKMFSLDLGFRNDLLDVKSNVGELRPYVGASIYFRIDNPDKKQMKKFIFILISTLLVCKVGYSQTGEGKINYKSYKTHSGNGATSSYNGEF